MWRNPCSSANSESPSVVEIFLAGARFCIIVRQSTDFQGGEGSGTDPDDGVADDASDDGATRSDDADNIDDGVIVIVGTAMTMTTT